MFHGVPLIGGKLKFLDGTQAAQHPRMGELGAKFRKEKSSKPMEYGRLSLLARLVLNFGTYASLCRSDRKIARRDGDRGGCEKEVMEVLLDKKR
ncbi:hypothetical protein [Undibacterium sp. TJN19]|uniref:hypothetical protein n=1 Tax=Undibacterium sp. TJN19 TaxID=3413055 RepID=UPI003BF1DF15